MCALILFFGRLRAPRPPPFADHWDQGFRSASRAPCLQNCSVPVGWPWPTPRRGKEGINRIAGRHQLDTVQLNWTVTYGYGCNGRTPVAVAVVSLAVMCSYGPDKLLGAFE